MFNTATSLQVKYGNNAYVDLGQYITEVKFSYNKIWAGDSGRNLAGTMTGTLIGIFPKIIVTFRKLNKTELETIIPIIDSARQTFKYYDPYKKASREMTTYTGDYEIVNQQIVDAVRKNEGFDVSFIAVSKRS